MKLSEKEFLTLVGQHKGILYKISRMYFEDPDDQQDLFQVIILQLWISIDSFKGNSKLSSWIYRVALNTAIVFFKREKKKADRVSVANIDTLAIDVYDTEKDVQLAHFYKAVNALNKIEKALIFQFIEGLSGKEIADNLGMSEVNVRVRTNRTKTKLQEIIKQQGYGF